MNTPHPSAHAHKRQGQLRLVLLGSAAALAACQPSTPPYSTQPEQLTRAGYTTREACAREWGGDDQCEEAGGYVNSATSSGGGGGGGSGGARYWGPYYSSSGRIYGYDGVTRPLMRPPTHATVTQSFTGSEHQVYSSGQGKYAAAKANISRGGFGGGGRGGFSFGG